MATFQLLNGKRIDEYMVEAAMDDANTGNLYFLNKEKLVKQVLLQENYSESLRERNKRATKPAKKRRTKGKKA